MCKRLISSLLICVLLLSFMVMPAFASEFNSGIATLEEDDLVLPIGERVNPSWSELQRIVSLLPLSKDDATFDSYIIWFASGGSYGDGSAHINVTMWDSASGNAYCSSYKFYIPGTIACYYFDYDNTGTWVEFVRSSPVTINSVYQIYTNQTIYTSTTYETVLYEPGPLGNYVTYLADDESYTSGDLLVDPWDSVPDDTVPDDSEEDKDYSGILGWLRKLWDNLTEGFLNVVNAINSMAGSIGSFFADIGNLISGFFETLLSGDWLIALFVPDEDFLEDVMTNVNSSIENSEFLLTIRLFVKEFTDFLQQDFTTPPSVNVNLSAAEGKYNYGLKTVNLLDVSWFSRYRKYTDPFISAMLWIGFIWLLAKRLPDILNGAGMITGAPADVVQSAYVSREKSNKESYETYAANRERKEEYSARYHSEHGG